jgi:imidazolonepropionase
VSLLIKEARVVTAEPGPLRGRALGQLRVWKQADVRVSGERIEAVAECLPERPCETVIEARGRVLMPAFVDCHTHLCWAGDRLDEWEQKLSGASYLEILASGGGILSTVRAVRKASEAELASAMAARLATLLAQGTTTVEVKSGYGLSTEDELKMLRAIRQAAAGWPGTVVLTALLGHAKDPEQADFVERTIEETLPAVSREFPGIAVDVYCEDGAWNLEESLRLLAAAKSAGHPVRVHADQFHDRGMIPAGTALQALSIDHLESTTPSHLDELAASRTYGVVLPISGFHTDGRYADARRLVDAGGAVALATNWNPGSAPSGSMPLAIALAVRGCKLTPTEALGACTANAAALLGFADRGVIAPGLRADLILLRHRDERLLAYEIGGNPVDLTLCGGRPIPQDLPTPGQSQRSG